MENIKLGFKLIKFNTMKKQQLLIIILVELVYLVILAMERSPGSVRLYLMVISMWGISVADSLYNIEYSEFVMASPKRYFISVIASNILSFILAATLFVILFLCLLIRVKTGNGDVAEIGSLMVWTGLCELGIEIYMAITKKSIAARIVWAVFCIWGLTVCIGFIEVWRPDFLAGLLAGIGFIILGCILSYLIRRLLYKKAVPRFVVAGEMKKYV